MTPADCCDAELAAIAALPRDLSLEDRIGAEHGWLDWNEEKKFLEENEYSKFIEKKSQLASGDGFASVWMPDQLFDFQQFTVDWALRRGRGAILANCGLGKTPMQLTWAENVVRHTNKRVMIFAPLAVSPQTIREGEKFGIEVRQSRDGSLGGPGIYIANYERIHYFDPNDFIGMVCDESSAIKAFDGKRQQQVTAFSRKLPYRLLCTATAAPNDYVELGTQSEALGELGHMDMLNRFFKNDNNTSDTRGHWRGHSAPRAFEGQRWRFRGHSEKPFWRWVCSWARACRKPSDLGQFDDSRFILPDLIEREHVVEARTLADGMLFSLPATNMQEEREERRRTIAERCEKAAELAMEERGQSIIWCHLNQEGTTLRRMIKGSREIAGATSDEEKEEIFEAFSSGQLRNLVIKPKIGAWGLNWQQCGHVITFASHSFEQYYQAVRRCWRFGRTDPVTVDIISTEGEAGVKANLQRKAAAAEQMFENLVLHMNHEMRVQRLADYDKEIEVPSW